MYTLAKYLRISAEDIDLDGFDKYESNSIANQRALLDDFISKVPEFVGCEVIEELDDGRTGTNFSRPGIQWLIEMAQAGKLHCIIVKDLSLFGRNYLEAGDYLEQKFPTWGVRFISLNDNYDSASLIGATGGIDIAFRNLIYELYSQDLSEKVRSAKASAAKSGKYTNALTFYGYIKDLGDTRKLAVDPPAATVVQRIFDLAAQGKTPNQIAKALNDDRIPTPQQRKIELGSKRRWTDKKAIFWYGSVISVIIRDERYTGKLIYGKKRTIEVGKQKAERVPESDWIVVQDAIPAIITEEQYKAANAHQHRKPHQQYSKSNLLFSRKLKCGHCGMAMRAVHRTNDVKYHCDTSRYADDCGCSNEEWVYESDIATAVLAALKQQIAFADEARKMLETKTEQLTPSIEKLQNEVVLLQKKIEKHKTAKLELWEKLREGIISSDTFGCENARLDTQIEKYQAKIPELQERVRTLETETGRENIFVERFSRQVGLQELTRNAIEEFISEVKVYTGGRIEVVFNFADEYEKVGALQKGTKKKRKLP